MKLDIQKFAATINFGTITENDPTMVDLNWGIFVANHSYVNIPVSGTNTAPNIRRIRLTVGSRAYEQTFSPTRTFNVTFNDCVITTSGTINIQVRIYDTSNQQIGSKSTTITAVTCTEPQITNAIAKRVNSSNVESPNGEYLNYTFEGTIDSVSNHNAHTFRIGYRETGTTTYTYANVETSSYTCNKTNIFVPGWYLDAGKEYDIVFEAIDSFTTKSTARNIESGFDLMNFNASGLAMAIGKVSSASANEELLEIGLPTKFYDAVKINNINVYPNIYSTSEIAIGTWIDGKTLYSKTFTGLTTGSNAHNLTNLDTFMIDSSHSFILKTTGRVFPIGYCAYDGVDFASTSVSTTDIYIAGTIPNFSSATVALLYTKN